MNIKLDLGLIVCSYALGCCTAGYYWTLWTSDKDIRRLGSGSVGAANVGRTLGAFGFAVTFVFDLIKGAVVVVAAHHFQIIAPATVACMAAVTAGHIWPIQLGFHGGKGIATSLGVICIYNYSIAVILLCLFAAVFIVSRRFVLSGMLAYCFASLFGILFGFSRANITAITVLAALVLYAHRRNIREDLPHLVRRRSTQVDPILEAGEAHGQ